MRAHVSVLGPVESHSKPFWFAIAFAKDGEAVAQNASPNLAEVGEPIAFELRRRPWSGITCDSEIAPFGQKFGWTAGPRPPAVQFGTACFALVLAHGPDGNRLRPAVIADLFAASEAVWQAAPWRTWGEEPFAIEVDGESVPRIAVCMGQAGTNYGLMLFDSAKDYDSFLRHAMRGDSAAGAKVRQFWLALDDEAAWAVAAVRDVNGLSRYPVVGGAHKGRRSFPKAKDLAILIATARMLAEATPGGGRIEVVQTLPDTGTPIRVALRIPGNDDGTADPGDEPEMVVTGQAAKKLNAKERKRLDAILAASREDAPIRSLTALHGFLTAIVSGPELTTPSAWLPLVLEGADGSDIADMQALIDLAMRLYNDVAQGLASGGQFKPLFDGGSRGVPADPTAWCVGYVDGMTFSGENAWARNADPLTVAKLVTPILAFAGAKAHPRTPDIPSARTRAAAMIGSAAQAAYDFWRERRMAAGNVQ